jgi:MFS family permease
MSRNPIEPAAAPAEGGEGDGDPIPLSTTDPKFGPVDVEPRTLELDYATPPAFKMDRRFVTAALMLVMVLASMEQTVTSTAMPTIIGDLHGLEHYSWVPAIYLLTCTVSMPLYGRLADVLGRRRVIFAAIVIFTVSSLLASTAHTMAQLIVYRGLQGLGAGGIMPVVLTIIGDLFTLKERAAIQGLFSAVWGTSSLAGPALGWLLVHTLGWRSVFYVNLPFGFLGLAVLMWKYRDHEKPHSVDLDLTGIIALGVASMTILTLFSGLSIEGTIWGYSAERIFQIGLGIIAVATTTFFIRHERRAVNPVLPPALIMRREIGPAVVGSLLLGVAFLSLDTYVPLYVQGARGGGAGAAAGVVTPVMLTWATSGVLIVPLMIRWGFRRTALGGTFLIAIAFAGLVLCVLTGAPRWVLTAVLAVAGVGFAAPSMSYLIAAQEAVAWQQRGIITSAVQFARTFGGSIGIGLLGGLFNLLTHKDLAELARQGANTADVLNPEKHARLAPAMLHRAQQLMGGALLWVFAAMLALALLQIWVTSLMSRKKAEHKITKVEALEAMAG